MWRGSQSLGSRRSGSYQPAGPGGRRSRALKQSWERLEERSLLSVNLIGDYSGLDYNQSGGYVPPDTSGAAGPSGYVESVNQTLALYTSKTTGAGKTLDSFSDFWYARGSLSKTDAGSFLSDPIVTYDDQAGRFIVGDQDVDPNALKSNFDIAVSKTNNPTTLTTADWNFYQVSTTESGYDADYPGNFGFNHDAFVFTLNMFGSFSDHALVVSVSSSDLVNGVSQSLLHVFKNDLNGFNVRPTTMHDSVANDPMWLVTEHGDGHSIEVVKMTGVLSSTAAFSYTNLPVTSYSSIVPPLNPNGTVVTDNVDSRILKAAESNKTIVATHAVSVSSTQDVAQWYKIDVSSGTPRLADQGRVSAGSNTYLYYPAIDINPTGQIGLTYMRSGTDSATDYMSMYVTGSTPTDQAGTMETPILVPAGTGRANYSDFTFGGRAGDLSGINVDPSNGTFWAANEFANTEATANWGTAIANFSLSPPKIAINDVGRTEGNSGTTGFTFTVSLSPASIQTVTVHWATADGTATTSDSDYQGASGTLTFQPGQTTQTITIPVIGDTKNEPDETFFVNLSSPSSPAIISRGQGTGTIVNDDPGQAIQTLVAKDGTHFVLDEHAELWQSVSTGGWTKIDRAVMTIALDADGTLYDLRADGSLVRVVGGVGSIFDTNDRAIAATADGSLYVLRADGLLARVVRGAGSVFDTSVIAMAATPDGSLYDLRADKNLWQYTGSWRLLSSNVQSMALATDGRLYYLRTNGDLIGGSGGNWTTLDSNVHTIVLATDDSVIATKNDGSQWRYYFLKGKRVS
jgi:hypothetical protein